ncbi:MAG TPA: polysaccharide deacetylase family protein [Pyrinomonadaceae bacterium]|nr:polysaccharide deacetylase family protein [Pyrinomonadaceae bacterium]
MKPALLIVIIIFAVSPLAFGQAASPGGSPQSVSRTLPERLGYPADAKLLIVHADDLGMAHSVNAASAKAFESGLVSSGSIMVPCPWFPEIAAYARSHPEADLGLHLTLTSEWSSFRWGPASSKESVASLLSGEGYLYPTEMEAARHADARQVEAEIRAQIERARAGGLRPTHLDSHMGTLYQNEPLFQVFLRVAHDNRLPIRISRDWLARAPFIPSNLGPDDIVIDRIIEIGPNVPPENWAAFYAEAVRSIRPGVTEIVVHLAYDDEEMRAATSNHPAWGAAWRQRDFDFFTGERFRRLLQENNVKLVTWAEIAKLLQRPQR